MVLYESVSGKGHSLWLAPWFLPVYTLSALQDTKFTRNFISPMSCKYLSFRYTFAPGRYIAFAHLPFRGNFCSCILKTCKRNMISLPRTWIICFQLNLDRKAVKCVKNHSWEKSEGYKEFWKLESSRVPARENQQEKGTLQRAVLNGNLAGSLNQVSIWD